MTKDFTDQLSTCYQRGFSWLMDSRNEDGVWGAHNGFPSDVLSTWHAVAFLCKKQEFRGLVREIYSWLMKCRNSDGGWAAFPEQCSRLYPTCSALASLSRIREIIYLPSIDEVIEKAISFIFKFRNADGSFSFSEGTPGSLHATKRAVQALQLALPSDFTIQQSIRWLLSKRDWNGSWGDVHLTCDMLSTLASIASEEEREASIAISIQWVKDQQCLDGSWRLAGMVNFAGPTLFALLKSGTSYTDLSIQRGMDYVLRTQKQDGGWAHSEKSRISTTNPTCWILSALYLILSVAHKGER